MRLMIYSNLLKLLTELFIIKNCVVFSLTSFCTGKYDCVMKTKEVFYFQPLMNDSMGKAFLLLILLMFISSNTLRIFLFFPAFYSLILLWRFLISMEYSVKGLGSWKLFRPTSSHFLIRN